VERRLSDQGGSVVNQFLFCVHVPLADPLILYRGVIVLTRQVEAPLSVLVTC
jgi:hypothetical protein